MRPLDREAWLIRTGQEERLNGTQANLNAAFTASTGSLDKTGGGDGDRAQSNGDAPAEIRTQL